MLVAVKAERRVRAGPPPVADAAAQVQAKTLGDIVVAVETTALVNLVADTTADAVE